MKEDISVLKLREVAKCYFFFQWFVCRVSRKVGLLKRRVRSQVVRGEIKNCTPLWRKAHFEVKMYQTRQVRSIFCCSPFEKMHAAVAKHILGSENVQNMIVSERFLKFRCWKITRRCGEKHMWKWKLSKHEVLGALFEVLMTKNYTPLWRNVDLQVKMLKNWGFGSTFWSSDVEKMHATVAKRTFWSKNVQNTSVSDHFSNICCAKIARHSRENQKKQDTSAPNVVN